MGFGFNLLFILVLLPVSGILLVLWLGSRKRIFGSALAGLWIVIITVIFIASLVQRYHQKTILSRNDYNGEYVIDRNRYSGRQADWQYNHFRFEIRGNDSLYFYLTDTVRLVKTYTGRVQTTDNYHSQRLVIAMDTPVFHLLSSNPTTYRSNNGFWLVFNSPKYRNVFFKKGKWKKIGAE